MSLGHLKRRFLSTTSSDNNLDYHTDETSVDSDAEDQRQPLEKMTKVGLIVINFDIGAGSKVSSIV